MIKPKMGLSLLSVSIKSSLWFKEINKKFHIYGEKKNSTQKQKQAKVPWLQEKRFSHFVSNKKFPANVKNVGPIPSSIHQRRSKRILKHFVNYTIFFSRLKLGIHL